MRTDRPQQGELVSVLNAHAPPRVPKQFAALAAKAPPLAFCVVVVAVVVVLKTILELALSLPKRARKLREFGAAEQYENNDENDEEFWWSEVHTTRVARPTRDSAADTQD